MGFATCRDLVCSHDQSRRLLRGLKIPPPATVQPIAAPRFALRQKSLPAERTYLLKRRLPFWILSVSGMVWLVTGRTFPSAERRVYGRDRMPGEPSQRSFLLSLLGRMLDQLAPGSVALLRPLPSDFDPRRDDVDLLMSETTRAELLNLLATLATNVGRTERSEYRHPSDCRAIVPNAHERLGQSFYIEAQECCPVPFHFRVSQVRREKIRLTLWDLHCESSLQVDLWSEFRQFPNRRFVSVPAEALLAMNSLVGRTERSEFRQLAHAPELAPLGPAYGSAAVEVLRPDVHFCLLVLHLASKRKSLSSAVTRERLTDAFERLKAWAIDGTHDMSTLLTLAESMLNATTLAQTVVTAAETYLLAQVTSSSPSLTHRISRVLDNARGDLRRWWMKQVPCIAIDGSDGAGKTTLIRSLCHAANEPMKSVVAKKLYRRSWVYQIVHSR